MGTKTEIKTIQPKIFNLKFFFSITLTSNINSCFLTINIISFLIGNIHAFDAGTIIDKFGVAVRTGHHCTQPLMQRFGIPGTIRASFSFYNTKEEIDVLVEAALKAKKMLS